MPRTWVGGTGEARGGRGGEDPSCARTGLLRARRSPASCARTGLLRARRSPAEPRRANGVGREGRRSLAAPTAWAEVPSVRVALPDRDREPRRRLVAPARGRGSARRAPGCRPIADRATRHQAQMALARERRASELGAAHRPCRRAVRRSRGSLDVGRLDPIDLAQHLVRPRADAVGDDGLDP